MPAETKSSFEEQVLARLQYIAATVGGLDDRVGEVEDAVGALRQEYSCLAASDDARSAELGDLSNQVSELKTSYRSYARSMAQFLVEHLLPSEEAYFPPRRAPELGILRQDVGPGYGDLELADETPTDGDGPGN